MNFYRYSFYLLFSLCFLCIALSGFTQTDSTFIENFQNTKLSKKERLTNLLQVGFKMPTEDKIQEEQNILLDNGMELAKSIGDYKNMYELMILHTKYSGDQSDEKIEKLNNLISDCDTKGWDSLYVAAIYWKARVHGLRNENPKASEILNVLANREDNRIAKYPSLHAQVFEELAILKKGRGDVEGTIKMYEVCLSIFEEQNDSIGMCSNLMNIGYTYLEKQDFEKFQMYTDKGLVIAKKLKRRDFESNGCMNYSAMYGRRGMYDSCLIYGLRLEQLSKELNDQQNEAVANDVIAACYLNLGQLSKALSYQLKGYQLVNEDYYKEAMALNVGLVYVEMEDYSMASKYYDTALITAKNMKSDWDLANVYNHKGFLNLKQDQYNKALTNFNLASDKETTGDYQFLINETNRGLAMTHEKLGNSEISNEYIAKTLLTQNSLKQLKELYLTQSTNFEKLGEYTKAYQAHLKYTDAKDSLAVQSNKELEQKILAQYSVEKAEAEVAIAERDLLVSDLNAERQRRMKLFGFLLLGLSLISILVIVSRHRKFLAEREKTIQLEKEAAQALLDKSRSVLTSQSELILNKNRLIEELKNNLNTLFDDVAVDTAGMNSFLDAKILTKEDWNKFKVSFTVVYPTFITRANELYPNLTASELRLLCLQKLGMNTQESADMLGVLHDSVKRTTLRIFQKFNIASSMTLQEVAEGIQ